MMGSRQGLHWKTEYTGILFVCGIFANMAIAVLNGVLGFVNRSPWQGSLCAYYLLLMLMKIYLLFTDGGGRRGLSVLWRKYLYVSVGILVLDLVLGGVVYLMATDQGTKHYPGMLIYAVAFYAFCKVISAAVNLIRAGRRRAPVMMAMKSIGTVDGMVSILMLEIALIDTFGNLHSDWSYSMMAATGAGVWLLSAAIGILGILQWRRHRGGRMVGRTNGRMNGRVNVRKGKRKSV